MTIWGTVSRLGRGSRGCGKGEGGGRGLHSRRMRTQRRISWKRRKQGGFKEKNRRRRKRGTEERKWRRKEEDSSNEGREKHVMGRRRNKESRRRLGRSRRREEGAGEEEKWEENAVHIERKAMEEDTNENEEIRGRSWKLKRWWYSIYLFIYLLSLIYWSN